MWSEAFWRGKRSSAMQIGGLLDEELGPLNKRLRSSFSQQWSQTSNKFLTPPSHQYPLQEHKPLGLQLKKSKSFLELIQMAISQNKTSCSGALDTKKDNKFKASNFAASRLKIGSWEFITKNAGSGLTAKFYFAKHKLVWEVLDHGLKYKIEIQWSDITALKADCPEKEPGTLTIVLGKQPLFFKETDPQPKKHTLWHASADFTGGQASTHRQHFLEFPPGVLDKHYQKLIQCDARLGLLSQLPETILDSPFFVTGTSDLVELRDQGVNSSETARVSPISGLQDVAPLLYTTSNVEIDNHSPTSGTCATNSEVQSFQSLRNQQQFEVPVIRPSLSSDDLASLVEHFISEQTTSEGRPSQEKASNVNYDLEELHRILFSDTTTTLDENFMMSRVNSLCNLIELDRDPDNTPSNRLVDSKRIQYGKLVEPYPGCELMPENRVQVHGVVAREEGLNVVTGHKQLRSMTRKDSYVELLHGLPRISSHPQIFSYVG